MSFKKKLVEKDVEVTVVEKRVVTMYEYEGKEYTKDDLRRHLNDKILNTGDNKLREMKISKGIASGGAVHTLLRYTRACDWIDFYKSLEECIKLYEELNEE